MADWAWGKGVRKLCGAVLLALPVCVWADAWQVLPTTVQTALHQANLQADDVGALVVPIKPSHQLPDAFSDQTLSSQALPSPTSDTKTPVLGVPILSHLADTPRIPASTQKLITTAAALDVLGEDFVWHNQAYHTGVVSHKTLYGDVVLAGSGDPSLNDGQLKAWLDALHQKVWHITGDIYLDTSLFGRVGYDPNAFDGQGFRPYNAEPSALLLNFGTLEIVFSPTPFGVATVETYPRLSGFLLPSFVPMTRGCQLPTVVLTDDRASFAGSFGADCGKQSVWRNFANNDMLAIKAVTHYWQSLDPTFAGKVKIGKPKTVLMPLVGVHSKPLSEQIFDINHFSNNVMTEQLALSLPVYAGGTTNNKGGSTYPQAFALLDNWWQGHALGLSPKMSRASGLCKDCMLTPAMLGSLLVHMSNHRAFEVFLQSLPVAGQSGTMKSLAKRNPSHPAIGRAWIKTGTLNDVLAMAGYVRGQSGQWYALVVIINAEKAGYNPKATMVLDELLAWAAHQ